MESPPQHPSLGAASLAGVEAALARRGRKRSYGGAERNAVLPAPRALAGAAAVCGAPALLRGEDEGSECGHTLDCCRLMGACLTTGAAQKRRERARRTRRAGWRRGSRGRRVGGRSGDMCADCASTTTSAPGSCRPAHRLRHRSAGSTAQAESDQESTQRAGACWVRYRENVALAGDAFAHAGATSCDSGRQAFRQERARRASVVLPGARAGGGRRSR
jgi:hypothetical protein